MTETKPTNRERARNYLKRAQAQGCKRVTVMLSPEAAAALLFLRKATGQSARVLIEGMLLDEHERVLGA